MPKMRFYFYECEHTGDLQNYADDFRAAGVAVSGMGMESEDGETGWLDVPYSEGAWPEVAAKLKGCPALDFYNGRQKMED